MDRPPTFLPRPAGGGGNVPTFVPGPPQGSGELTADGSAGRLSPSQPTSPFESMRGKLPPPPGMAAAFAVPRTNPLYAGSGRRSPTRTPKGGAMAAALKRMDLENAGAALLLPAPCWEAGPTAMPGTALLKPPPHRHLPPRLLQAPSAPAATW